VPLLARMLLSPLFIDIRAGAVSGLGDLLADRRISADGHVAVAVGPGQGEQVVEAIRPSLGNADIFVVRGGSLEAAGDLQAQLRGNNYDALVGIGGGRTLDVAKYAATRLALPMVAVATNLAHDGIASPVSSLLHEGGKGSFGVVLPMAVVVDLDYVRTSPPRMVLSGVGDVISNLTAIEDWWLAAHERGEPIDGLAVTFGRTAAESVLHRTDGLGSDNFLTTLAEAIVLSGMAMAAAGSSRPASGADHEIMHAIDTLFPGTANHGELAGVGALFSAFLRENDQLAEQIDSCLRHFELPRVPADLGLSDDQFAEAVSYAPQTRPDRYTILEHLDLDAEAVRERTSAFVATYAPSAG
jgi:glycerol-1-phosphate dehydrogenase [NAD(P)+]